MSKSKSRSANEEINIKVCLSNSKPSPAFSVRSSRQAFRSALASVVFSSLVSPVKASLDATRCCMIQARQQLIALDENPWTACGLGVTITNPLKQIYASVNTTKSWAVENCPGFQLSTLDEWLQPMAQWFAPFLTLLLLCPIGENVEESENNVGIQINNKDKSPRWKRVAGFAKWVRSSVSIVS
jgi:hypothetical protein